MELRPFKRLRQCCAGSWERPAEVHTPNPPRPGRTARTQRPKGVNPPIILKQRQTDQSPAAPCVMEGCVASAHGYHLMRWIRTKCATTKWAVVREYLHFWQEVRDYRPNFQDEEMESGNVTLEQCKPSRPHSFLPFQTLRVVQRAIWVGQYSLHVAVLLQGKNDDFKNENLYSKLSCLKHLHCWRKFPQLPKYFRPFVVLIQHHF